MQIKKGLVEILILNILSESDNYGYEIRERVGKVFAINESSIYMSLSKLEDNKHIESYLKPSVQGPARRYFKITDLGKKHLEESIKEWKVIYSNVNKELGVK